VGGFSENSEVRRAQFSSQIFTRARPWGALKEINKHSDIQLELEFIGRGTYRKVLSLGLRITARKHAKR